MAKKKKSVDLSARNITYETDDGTVKILRFNPNMMTVDINLYTADNQTEAKCIPFAHLPKPVKKLVRPL